MTRTLARSLGFAALAITLTCPCSADDAVKERFLREYPRAGRLLAESLDGVKGTCLLGEARQGNRGKFKGVFAADHGSIKLVAKLGASGVGQPGSDEFVFCGNQDRVFYLTKMASSPDYRVMSAGNHPETASEFDERFRMLLKAPYSIYDGSLNDIIKMPSYGIDEAKEVVSNGKHLVSVRFKGDESPPNHALAILDPDLGWAVQRSEYIYNNLGGRKYEIEVQYGPIVNGIPTLKRAEFKCPDYSYQCEFESIVREPTDEREFGMEFYKLPNLVDRPSSGPGGGSSSSFRAWLWLPAGVAALGAIIFAATRRGR